MKWYQAILIACAGWLMIGLFALGAKWYLESEPRERREEDEKKSDRTNRQKRNPSQD